jgi:hypothetical protein
MIIIVNSDEEERSVWAAIETIRVLRGEAHPLKPYMQDSPWIKTKWANERYL